MLYIMKRTQLYLEEDLWEALHARARREKTTISDLVRRAARERYMYTAEQRRADMMAAVGIWKDRTDLPDDSLEASKILRERMMQRTDAAES